MDVSTKDKKSLRWIFISWRPKGTLLSLLYQFICIILSLTTVTKDTVTVNATNLVRGKQTDNHDLLSRRKKAIPKSVSGERQKAIQKPNSTDSLSSGHFVFDPG